MSNLLNNSNLFNSFLDTMKMKLFEKIKSGNILIDTVISTFIIGIFSYFMKIFYDIILTFSFSSIFYTDFYSLIYKKNCVELEGRKSHCISAYNISPVVSSVFSNRFKAVWYNILENIEKNKTIYHLKEQYCNDYKTKNDSFMVVQKKRFIIDKNIYAYTEIEEIENNNKESKIDTKIDKIKIIIYSYKLSIKELIQYIEKITEKYLKNIQNSRKDISFVYTLNKIKFEDSKYECWSESKFESVKTFDNTFFDKKEFLLKNLNFFLNNKEWYYKKGRPYTLGIALHGPPGTGKTSLIKAISNYTKRHIIIFSMKIIKTRQQLIDFFFESTYNINNDVNSINFDKKIIVIEDIDCIGDIILDRSKNSNKKGLNLLNNSNCGNIKIGSFLQTISDVNNSIVKEPIPSNIYNDDPITLDDILNLWDGINETSGRILIISSNHYNKLDPALIRPGRIDCPIELGNASHETISQIYKHYYSSKICKKSLKKIKEFRFSAASIINICFTSSSKEEFIKRLIKLK
jgi:SpoVK/Ycf46/Vps4 family AAA+-type ATPase